MDITIYLNNTQAETLFNLKDADGRDDLTAEEYARELFIDALTVKRIRHERETKERAAK